MKAEQKQKEKAEKPQAAEETKSKPKDALKDEEISPNEYFKLRSTAVQQMKESPLSPYPHKYQVDTSLQIFIDNFQHLTNGEALTDKTHSIAGNYFSSSFCIKLHF